jgi:hypothetical protein
MEDGYVWADEPGVAYFLNESIRVPNRQPDRLAKRMPGAGSFGVSIVQGRQCQDRERVHS